MKTNIHLGVFSLFLILSLSSDSFGQSTSDDNFPGPSKFLGFNGAQDLDFRTNNLTHMRMMQSGNSNINGFNIDRSGFVALSQNAGVFGLPQATAFSLLHLNGDNGPTGGPQQLGYRDWMRHGIVFTHNADLMYIGPRRTTGLDKTDAVIAWADNTPLSQNGPDNLVFMFTTGNNLGADLELGRMTAAGYTGLGNTWSNTGQPRRTLDVIREQNLPQFRLTRTKGTIDTTGIHADFQVDNTGFLHILPRKDGFKRPMVVGFLPGGPEVVLSTTTLDIGGITRIRQLDSIPTPRTLIMGYQFEDVNEGDDDHFLGRIDFPDDSLLYLDGTGNWSTLSPSDSDCRWIDNTSPTVFGETDIHIGFSTQDSCYRGKVAIGHVNAKFSKLEVTNLYNRDRVRNAISGLTRSEHLDTAPISDYTGVYGKATSQNELQGVNSIFAGVHGDSEGGGYSLGVRGTAEGNPIYTQYAIGVYGKATDAPFGRNIGGYFEGERAVVSFGAILASNFQITLSDENVKSEIEPINNAMEILSQLQPKSYYMSTPDNRELYFDDDLQYGFLAQDVEQILPHLVEDFDVPNSIDSSGFIPNTGMTLKGIQYQAFIPLLVSGFNEQNGIVNQLENKLTSQDETIASLQAIVEDQNELLQLQASEIEFMKAQIAETLVAVSAMQQKTHNCCQNQSTETGPVINEAIGNKQMELGQNVPNPFDQTTRIDFTLPAEAQIILEISDAQGRPIRKLIDGQMSQGQHSFTFDGSGLASGIYYYTIYANGELLTKRMMKL